MTLEDQLFEILKNPDYVPLTYVQLVEQLNIPKKQEVKFKELLARLLGEGDIARVKKDRYVIPKDADMISGIIKFRASGSARLFPDSPPGTPPPDPIEVKAADTYIALHGDHVLARVYKPKPTYRYKKGKRVAAYPDEIFATVKHVLERANKTVTGTLKLAKNYAYVIPDDPRIAEDIVVPDPSKSRLKPKPKVDDKVVVKLIEWENCHLNPEGTIVRVLGKTHSPNAEYEALLHKFELNPEFPNAVMREVEKLPTQVRPKDIVRRLDYTRVFTITIDPDDAKDFDDAISIEKLKDGKTRVGVHIADVGAYVTPRSELDKEARKRGNSTYLVGTVIPMLPHALSNGICSLVENQNRLTKAVFFDFDNKGDIQDTTFANTVICSSKRLTYKQAYAFLTESDPDVIRKTPMPPAHQTGSIGKSLKDLNNKEINQIRTTIKTLWKFASKIRRRRMSEGSLDLDMPEVKIYVDPTGRAERIETVEYDESHQLIEEYMLAANEAVAKALFDMGLPSISRVHDSPETEKLNDLRDIMATFNIQSGDLTNRNEVVKLLKKISVHEQSHILKVQFLRSLKQACYRAATDGHYGLFKTHYTHFTSPIRRYADLIVHRMFDYYLLKSGNETSNEQRLKVYSKGELDELSQYISTTEQNSTEAERESRKIKLLEFFERELAREKKTPFAAIITEVRNHGMFIELEESMAFGMVHISTLNDDIYRLNQEGTALIGRKRGITYTVGHRIYVTIDTIDRFKRQMDFRIAPSPTTTDKK